MLLKNKQTNWRKLVEEARAYIEQFERTPERASYVPYVNESQKEIRYIKFNYINKRWVLEKVL